MPLWTEDQARDIARVPPVDQPTTITFSTSIFRPGYLRSICGRVFRTHCSSSQTFGHRAVNDVDFWAQPVVDADGQVTVC